MTETQIITQELNALDDDVRWQAVVEKDARFNGIFVYGVRSTGIYCKPSCAARLPGRKRVAFFASCTEAEAAGFRACLRCRPQSASDANAQVEVVKAACRLIEAETERPPSLADLSRQLNVSPHHLQRLFKSITGVTPRQYAAAHRLERFKTELRAGESVTNAMYDAGFGSSSRLYENAAEQLGMTPAVYRKGGKGMSIQYTIAPSPLGRLLVAATERGICAVAFADEDQALLAELRAEFPAADIQPDKTRLSDSVQYVLDCLDGAPPHAKLPLDLQATAFQMRVWEELRRIPRGETRSYAELAAAIGRPSATRAVARACATNPVALLNPCHRVIRGDGSLGGYRWGLKRKQSLLAQEKEDA